MPNLRTVTLTRSVNLSYLADPVKVIKTKKRATLDRLYSSENDGDVH